MASPLAWQEIGKSLASGVWLIWHTVIFVTKRFRESYQCCNIIILLHWVVLKISWSIVQYIDIWIIFHYLKASSVIIEVTWLVILFVFTVVIFLQTRMDSSSWPSTKYSTHYCLVLAAMELCIILDHPYNSGSSLSKKDTTKVSFNISTFLHNPRDTCEWGCDYTDIIDTTVSLGD